MARKLILAASALFSVGLFLTTGCNGDDNRDGGVKPRDGAPLADASDSDGGTTNTDGGPGDTGVQGPCNPVDGTGCLQAGEFCVLQTSNSEGQCRTIGAMNAFETACNPQFQDCGPGLACVQLQGDPGPTCYKACATAGGAGCAGLVGMSQGYTCGTVFQTGAAYGLCTGTGMFCNPAEGVAACGAMETCTVVSMDLNMMSCEMSGTSSVGGSCMASNCVPGGTCLNVGDGPTCYTACDTANPCANGPCAGLQNANWGICQTPCDPINPVCPANETCSIVTAMFETSCIGAGTAQLGTACSPQNNCAPGQGICLDVGMGPHCFEACDPMNAMCSTGMCQGLMGPTFGICQ